MQQIVLYAIKNEYDYSPSYTYTLAYTRDFDTAEKIAKGRGLFGKDAPIYPEIIKIFDSVEDYMLNK